MPQDRPIEEKAAPDNGEEKATSASVPVAADLTTKPAASRTDKLNRFVAEAKTEMEDIASRNSSYTLPQVKELISNYAEKASATIRIVLQSRAFDCDTENIIRFTVGSNYERESLVNETALLEYLRHHLKNLRITLGFIINPGLMESADDYKPVSREEKLRILNEKNPLVNKLIEKLNLKIEE